MMCETDDPKEEGQEDHEEKKGHGGCGHIQPVIRKEGLKMFVQYKKAKDDDDVGKFPCTCNFPDPIVGGEVGAV